jgi:hypothetical protein
VGRTCSRGIWEIEKNIPVRKPKEKRPFAKPSCRWRYGIETNII